MDVPDTPPQGKSHQGISKLLLLAMFAYAARYSGADAQSPAHTDARPEGGVSKAGNIYATRARTVLSKHIPACFYISRLMDDADRIYQNSRPSTCQALLLLGIREFGIGRLYLHIHGFTD